MQTECQPPTAMKQGKVQRRAIELLTASEAAWQAAIFVLFAATCLVAAVGIRRLDLLGIALGAPPAAMVAMSTAWKRRTGCEAAAALSSLRAAVASGDELAIRTALSLARAAGVSAEELASSEELRAVVLQKLRRAAAGGDAGRATAATRVVAALEAMRCSGPVPSGEQRPSTPTSLAADPCEPARHVEKMDTCKSGIRMGGGNHGASGQSVNLPTTSPAGNPAGDTQRSTGMKVSMANTISRATQVQLHDTAQHDEPELQKDGLDKSGTCASGVQCMLPEWSSSTLQTAVQDTISSPMWDWEEVQHSPSQTVPGVSGRNSRKSVSVADADRIRRAWLRAVDVHPGSRATPSYRARVIRSESNSTSMEKVPAPGRKGLRSAC